MAKPIKPSVDAKIEEILRRLKESNRVVLDLETSGLDWRKNHVAGWVFTFGPRPDDSYYVSVRHASNNDVKGPRMTDAHGWNGKPLPVEKQFLKLLSRQGLTVQGHHLNFDLKFLWRLGERNFDSRYEDSVINDPLIYEWSNSFSLEACARRAGVQAKKSDEILTHLHSVLPDAPKTKEAMGHYWRLPGDDKVAIDYARGDGTTTWQLIDWQMAQIAEQELSTVHDYESRLIPILIRMSCLGIAIDESRLAHLEESITARVADLMKELPEGMNVKSPKDVKSWCEDNGNTNWPRTLKKGMPSFPESWLNTHDAGRKVVAVRKLTTLLSSFILPMKNKHMHNGRVHCTYHQLRGDEYGVVTGRLSSSDPNMQAVSKRDEQMGRLHRSIFVADKGKTWLSADYVQCEPVLLAYYSRCKVLLNGYRADPPIDAHQAVADATGMDRQTGKRINQTLITGGGKGVLVSKYGMDPATVEDKIREYFEAMPEIRKLQKKATSVMRHRGYIISLLGRRSRLLNPDKDYQAMNRLLQCGNADVIKCKMVEIDDYLRSEGRPLDVLNNIHDDLSFQFTEDNRKHMNECLRIMSDFSDPCPIYLDVPLRTDAGEGKNWADATYGEEQ